MNDELLNPFTEEEIWKTVKSMAPFKAPGIYGYPTLFYQRYWYTIASHISKYCLSILHGQTKMGDINITRIILIPKVDKPKNIKCSGL